LLYNLLFEVRNTPLDKKYIAKTADPHQNLTNFNNNRVLLHINIRLIQLLMKLLSGRQQELRTQKRYTQRNVAQAIGLGESMYSCEFHERFICGILLMIKPTKRTTILIKLRDVLQSLLKDQQV
jgi:hypothetical protein